MSGRLGAAALALGLLAVACTSSPSGPEPPGAGPPAPPPPSAPRPGPGPIAFVDAAAGAGLDFRHGAFRWQVTADTVAMSGSGVCWLDYDGDGWLDLYAVNSHARAEAARWEEAGGLPRNALFHNRSGRFADVSEGSGADLDGRGTGCVAADFDRDGRTDLYVTGADAGALLWNEGDGTFREGAEAAGAPAVGWYAGAAAGDVDGDGWTDLFVAGYANTHSPVAGSTQGFPSTYTGVRDLLYLNEGRSGEGGATFREVGVEAGLEVATADYGLGALLSDLEGDGDLDLFVANDARPDRLYGNVAWPGGAEADPAGLGFRFEELAARAGVADPGAGMGVAGADYDGDGRDDLFVTNARGQVHGVFRGQESAAVHPSFTDVRRELGPDLGSATGWGVSWADLDLDTDLDLLVANGAIPVTEGAADREPFQVFAQGEGARFGDVGDAAGLGAVGPLAARGSAAADYDNDGDLDVAVTTVGGPLVLLENQATSGNWLEVDLGAAVPGATVTVTLPGGRTLTREIHAGSSYLSSEDPRAHVGLGDAAEVSRVVVAWPGGGETRITDVAVNQRLVVERPR